MTTHPETTSTPLQLLAFVIVLDAVLIIWFIVAYIIYSRRRKLADFFTFDCDNGGGTLPDMIRTITFCILNGSAVIIWLSILVSNYLEKL